MYIIEIHTRINQIIAKYYWLKMWQSERRTLLNVAAKGFFFTMHFSYVIAVFSGLFLCEDDEFIFQVAAFMAYLVVNVKLCYVLRQQIELCSFLQGICSHSIPDQVEFVRIRGKIDIFINFVTTFILLAAAGTVPFFLFRLPIFSYEKKLPITIGFPLDWRNNDFSYWTAYVFITFNHVLTVAILSCTAIIWYVMINCSIKYESLGSQFRRIGINSTVEYENISEADEKTIYLRQFFDLMRKYQESRKIINRFGSFFNNLFFLQITSSGIIICCSVYALVFSGGKIVHSVTYFAAVSYNFFDIFMITYFGNEIELSSARLSYCLFESNWIGQSKSLKACIVILAEILKHPHRILICKLYPLNLETFTAILNATYRMFNILLKLK